MLVLVVLVLAGFAYADNTYYQAKVKLTVAGQTSLGSFSEQEIYDCSETIPEPLPEVENITLPDGSVVKITYDYTLGKMIIERVSGSAEIKIEVAFNRICPEPSINETITTYLTTGIITVKTNL